MIDWIKYSSFSFRSSRELGEVKGPTFEKSKTYQVFASGNKISFKCPKHSASVGDPPFVLRGQDCVGRMTSSFSHMANTHWQYSTGFSRAWEYRKSWFRGIAGFCYMNMLVCSREDEHLFEDVSFFHPKGFEYALTIFLNAMFGVARPQLKYKYEGPVDWKARPSIFDLAVSFEIKPDNTFLCFPVSKTHFALFESRNPIVHKELRAYSDSLIESIIDSITIEFGSETKALIEEQKKSCPDWRITDDFPPLNWPIKPEEVEGSASTKIEELKRIRN